MNTLDPFEVYDGSQYKSRFFDGLKLFRNSDYAPALAIFRELTAVVDGRDVYRNKYRSYEGLTRVYLGEKSAVTLCREAAADEIKDAEVHYTHALAEFKLNNRRYAVAAVQRGLAIDSGYPELLRLRTIMGMRRDPIFRFLDRDHFLNKWLGKLTYKKPPKAGMS